MAEYKVSRTGGWTFARREKIRQVLKEKVERRENVADFRVRDRLSGEMPATEHPITKEVFFFQELPAAASTAPVTDKVPPDVGIPEPSQEDSQSVSPPATVSSEPAPPNNRGPLPALGSAPDKLARSATGGGSTVSSPHPSAPKGVSRARWLVPVVVLGLLALIASGFWLFRGDDEVPRAAGQRSPEPRDMTAPQGEDRIELTSSQRRRIQMGLKAAGFDPGPTDGVFGPATRAAIRQWQAERSAIVTGFLKESEAEELIKLSRNVVAAGLPKEKEGTVQRAGNESDRISDNSVAHDIAPESGAKGIASTQAPGNEGLTESNGTTATPGLSEEGTPAGVGAVTPQDGLPSDGTVAVVDLLDWRLPADPELLSKLAYENCRRPRRGYDICLELEAQLNKNAYAFSVFTVGNRLHGVPCGEDLPNMKAKSSKSRRKNLLATPEWTIQMRANPTDRMGFHVLATTDKETAERLFLHLKSAPGVCGNKDDGAANTVDIAAWLEELKLQSEAGKVAYLGERVNLP